MVCAHCRTQNPVGSMHCFNCGRDISKSTAEPIESAPVRKPASAEQIIGNVDINGTLLVINNTRVSFGYQSLKCDEIVGIRYGIFKNYVNGIRTSRSYAFWLSDRSSSMLIKCASAFASSATVEARYQATLSALYPAVIVPLLESFLANLSDGPGFQIATLTFDRNGLHRSNSYGAVQKGLLNAWVSMAGGKSVAEREQSYQHMTWREFGGHSFSDGNIRLYSRKKALWTQFSLRDTWNAVCLGPLLDFLYKDNQLAAYVNM
jgi:hypothetical protein